jgi:DEAD/DEAH box helicase domain-containing protein
LKISISKLTSLAHTGVQSPACKEGNLVSSKLGALLIFKDILGLEIDAGSIPFQGNEAYSTVVEASSVRNAGEVQIELDR